MLTDDQFIKHARAHVAYVNHLVEAMSRSNAEGDYSMQHRRLRELWWTARTVARNTHRVLIHKGVAMRKRKAS